MTHPLLSLFHPVSRPTFEPGGAKDKIYNALQSKGGRAHLAELVSLSGITPCQAQCALRYMKDHGYIRAKEVPRGNGRSFEYCLPELVVNKTTRELVLEKLEENGPMTGAQLSEALDIPIRRLQIVLSHSHNKHKNPGFTREKKGKDTLYTRSK